MTETKEIKMQQAHKSLLQSEKVVSVMKKVIKLKVAESLTDRVNKQTNNALRKRVIDLKKSMNINYTTNYRGGIMTITRLDDDSSDKLREERQLHKLSFRKKGGKIIYELAELD